MLKLLLDADINLNTSILRKTPLFVALTKGGVEMVKLLIEHGANVDGDEAGRRTFGWVGSPLCRAVRANQEDMVKVLLQSGANPYITAGWGASKTSPLQTAQAHADFPAAEILLKHDKRIHVSVNSKHLTVLSNL